MASLTPELARQNNSDPNSPNGFIPEVNGVVITRVYPKTPAETAGLRRLDVVVDIGGQKVERADDAQRIIDGARVNEVRFYNDDYFSNIFNQYDSLFSLSFSSTEFNDENHSKWKRYDSRGETRGKSNFS